MHLSLFFRIMLEHLRFNEKDDFFRYIFRLIPHSFELTDDGECIQVMLRVRPVFRNRFERQPRRFLIDLVQCVVFEKHLSREGGVFFQQRKHGIVHHGNGDLIHFLHTVFRKQFTPERMIYIEDITRDAFHVIADTFQVAVDLQRGEHKTEVYGNGLKKRENIFAIAVNFQLDGIHDPFIFDHLARKITVKPEQRVALFGDLRARYALHLDELFPEPVDFCI